MTTERKKEETLVMHGTVRDLTAHQIRSKCSGGGGDNTVRRRSGFLALFDNADTIVSTLPSAPRPACVI